MSNTPDNITEPGVTKRTIEKESKGGIVTRHRGVLALMTQGKTITEAMIAMRYKPNVVKTPTNITKSKSWAMLMDEFLPDDIVLERHSELLNKRDVKILTEWVSEPGKRKQKRVEREVDAGPNVPAVSKALEMAYKLRGSYIPEKPQEQAQTVYNLFYQPKVQASLRIFEDALKEQIINESIRDAQIVDRDEVDTGEPEADTDATA